MSSITRPYVYGYICISSAKFAKNDRQKLKETNQFKALTHTCAERSIKLDACIFDVIAPNRKDRVNLDLLSDIAHKNDVIVLDSITALGNNLYEAFETFLICNNNCLFYFLNCPEGYNFSTVESDLTTEREDGFKEFAKYVHSFGEPEVAQEIQLNYAGRSKNEITPEFKEVYWYFENYFIDEKTVLTNNKFHLAKTTFYSMCQEYESRKEYLSDLSIQDALYHIRTKPKRTGVVNKIFPDNYFAEVEASDSPLKKTLDSYEKLPPQSPLSYNRWLLKYNDGRKGLLAATKEYLSEELISVLTQ